MTKNGSKPDNLTPTSGAVWRRPRMEGVVIPLPSGNICRIRPVALDVMITSGKLPDLLTPLAAKTLWTELDTDQIGDVAEMATGMAELFGTVCRAAFIEPRIVDSPEADDEISLEDIDFADKAAVFQLAIQPAKVLEGFRQQQTRDVEPVRDGEKQPVEAK